MTRRCDRSKRTPNGNFVSRAAPMPVMIRIHYSMVLNACIHNKGKSSSCRGVEAREQVGMNPHRSKSCQYPVSQGLPDDPVALPAARRDEDSLFRHIHPSESAE